MCMRQGAILTRFDSREWGGADVMDMDGAAISLPAYSAAGEGHWFDVMDLLNGRGVAAAETLSALAAAGWTASTAGGTCTLYIDPATGHFALSTSAVDFAISAHADNALLGFDPAGHAAVGGGAPFVRVAPSPPVLAPLVDFSFTIDPAGAPAAFTVGEDRWYQDPYTAMRARGNGDADDINPTGNLEALLQAEYADASIRVGLDADRRVVVAWDSTGSVDAPTWNSATFRDALGLTGNEGTTTSGDVSYITAARMCPTVIPLEEGLDDYQIGVQIQGTAGELISGAAVSNTTKRVRTARIRTYILGPSMGPVRAAVRHWLDRGMPAPGEPVTIYPAWGDPRRWRDPWAVTGDDESSGDVVANNLTHTSLEEGYRGRFRGYLRSSSTRDVTAEWEGPTRQRIQVDLALREAP